MVDTAGPGARYRAALTLLPAIFLAVGVVIDILVDELAGDTPFDLSAERFAATSLALLFPIGVTFYVGAIAGKGYWPTWAATSTGFASIVPLTVLETGPPGNPLSLIALVIPMMALLFFRKQRGQFILLFSISALVIGIFVVLRVFGKVDIGVITAGLAIDVVIAFELFRRWRRA